MSWKKRPEEIKKIKKSEKKGIHVTDISSSVDERQKKTLSQGVEKTERITVSKIGGK